MTEPPPAGQRVVIAEDSVLLLAGLTKLLESAGFVVAATAGDAEGLLAAVERERPDVVIADVRMPPTHTDEGIRAALVIRTRGPRSRSWCCRSTWRNGTPLTCCRRTPAGSATC